MPLPEPPQEAGSLASLPRHPLRSTELFRVWRRDLPGNRSRPEPWWFASAATDSDDGGRFDLPEPMGSCYFGSSPEAAVLEALQMRLTNLPEVELRIRRPARIRSPASAPDAAMFTAARVAGEFGITAELWAGRNRPLTCRWAQATRRDGWWALYSGVSHDPSGRLRAIALFDRCGAHAPSHGGGWNYIEQRIDRDDPIRKALRRHGIHVRAPGQLPWARPPKS
jgi:hypothetical protein